ncbi:haloacid dehalogenase-like hydrolase (HAD) superfamily protein [Klebsormidium nitens]|uniref:Haloacid dehalogenase-like hydrolase (HAD) superfamily protein n=1 Tax=Klebsormidium nitens TaxID=105231 RepID=A0A1Y1I156_KLENI|nr:haloacid dehalogenase-like hydrolase (HAD) superfamily protein [Klebsormidium nitens]|eukprot:GAQ84644.1 haloacid dehalogenase-like hydrolase (HAD) superfamily protein [Klebsormidium nitens]
MVVNTAEQESTKRKLPVLLFDVMDTLIRDPFYEDMPKFFKLTLKELFAVKHPTAWIEFETGLISEGELLSKFFKDGRDFDLTGLKDCAYEGYRWIEGCEDLLRRVQEAGYEAHAFTNYPHWYKMIEEKLSLSRYLDWTFVSCHTGRRKPDLEAFMEAATTLGLEPQDCVFIDDRLKNVEAAQAVGMAGILFESASSLEVELEKLGISLESQPLQPSLPL